MRYEVRRHCLGTWEWHTAHGRTGQTFTKLGARWAGSWAYRQRERERRTPGPWREYQ